MEVPRLSLALQGVDTTDPAAPPMMVARGWPFGWPIGGGATVYKAERYPVQGRVCTGIKIRGFQLWFHL